MTIMSDQRGNGTLFRCNHHEPFRSIVKSWGRDTYRYKDVEKVFQRWKLRDELLDNFTEGLKDGVIIYTSQIETVEDRKKAFD